MGRKQSHGPSKDETAEVLKDILIMQLGMAGVPQQAIRKIVGCNMSRVTRIVAHLKSSGKEAQKKKKQR
jgi:hypothetical protein